MTNPDNIARRLAQGDHIETRWTDAVPWPEPPTERDLCHEGVWTSDGRLILPGALSFDMAPVPVTTRQGDGFDAVGVVGKVQNLRRRSTSDTTNTVSGAIWLHPVHGAGIDLSTLNCHIEIDGATSEDVPHPEYGVVQAVKTARLRCVFLSAGPGAWPDLDVTGPAKPDIVPDSIFGEPLLTGSASGSGLHVRPCLRCGSLVLDQDEWLDLHKQVHS